MKIETATESVMQREYSTDGTIAQANLLPNIRQSSIFGSMSPVETGSAVSVYTNNTVMENLKTIMYGKNPPVALSKIFPSHEEPLQPEVAYSDVQSTPRGDYYDDEATATVTHPQRAVQRERVEKANSGILVASGTNASVTNKVVVGTDKKGENIGELDEGDKKNTPII